MVLRAVPKRVETSLYFSGEMHEKDEAPTEL